MPTAVRREADQVADVAAWLRSRSDHALVGLLQSRPDLAAPLPADLDVLAARAVGRPSLLRALEDVDRLGLAVCETLVLLVDGVLTGAAAPPDAARDAAQRRDDETADADPSRGVPADDLVREVLRGAPPEQASDATCADRVRTAVASLRRRALLWDGPGGLLPVPGLRPLLPTHLGGLGRPLAVLVERLDADTPGLGASSRLVAAGHVRTVVDDLDDDARAVLEDLVAVGATPVPDTSTRDALTGAGLAVAVDGLVLELPRETGLALRGDAPLGAPPLLRPPLPTRPVAGGEPGAASDAASSQAATAAVAAVASLGELWGREPAPSLRAGGLGVRELRRAARALDVTERQAGVLAEVAAAAGLVVESRGLEPHLVPTAAFDAWLATPTEARWAALASAWLEVPRLLGMAGDASTSGRNGTVAPLGPEQVRSGAPALRREVLGVLAGLPRGHAPAAADVVAALAWDAPRRHGRARDRLVRDVLAEADLLGVLGGGALAGPGRALLQDGAPAAAQTLRPLLPAPVRELLVQPDGSLVAPGPLERDLAAEVALLADVESSGAATVYRVTERSLRRALDAGRTPEQVLDVLRTHSRTPVPQSLEFSVADVARRHGRLRAGPVGAYVRCEDEALLAEVVGSRAGAEAGLRLLAPTVAVSAGDVAPLVDALRGGGFSPVAEDAEGGVVVLADEPARAPAPPARGGRQPVRPLGVGQLSRLVKELRSASGRGRGGTRVTAAALPADEPRSRAADPVLLLDALSDAVRARRRVRLRFLDSGGRDSVRSVVPVSAAGGFVVARDPEAETTMTVALHRVTAVEPVG